MKCEKIIYHLNAYVDGELPEEWRCVVEAHLTTCGSCRERLEEIRDLAELFEDTLPVPPVPDGLTARIMAEARRRQPMAIPGNHSPLPPWNPLRWLAGLSAPMRLATCATVLLALVAGLAFDGSDVPRRNVVAKPGKDISGIEWFAPVPPNSIASIYIAMTGKTYEKGSK